MDSFRCFTAITFLRTRRKAPLSKAISANRGSHIPNFFSYALEFVHTYYPLLERYCHKHISLLPCYGPVFAVFSKWLSCCVSKSLRLSVLRWQPNHFELTENVQTAHYYCRCSTYSKFLHTWISQLLCQYLTLNWFIMRPRRSSNNMQKTCNHWVKLLTCSTMTYRKYNSPFICNNGNIINLFCNICIIAKTWITRIISVLTRSNMLDDQTC